MIVENGLVHEDPATLVAPFSTLSLAALAAFDFPHVEYVVENLIPAGSLVLAVGRPKAGKSLILGIDLCASVALGEPFLDRATAQGPALYVPAEDALRLVRDRLWTRLGSEREAPLVVLPADGSLDQSIRLDRPESFTRLVATVEQVKPRVIVLDPLRELHQRKENDADDMAALLRPLRQLAHDTETAIILIHHRNKHASDPSLASRGSSAIVGGVDIVMTLDLSGDEDDAELTPDKTITIKVEGRYGPRQRIGARLGTGLRWHPADPRLDTDIPTAERVLRHLQVTGEGLTAQELADQLKASLKTAQNVLSTMVKGGRVQRAGAGTKTDPFRYSAATAREAAGTNVSALRQGNSVIPPERHGYTQPSGGTIATEQRFCRVCDGLLGSPVDRERGTHAQCMTGEAA